MLQIGYFHYRYAVFAVERMSEVHTRPGTELACMAIRVRLRKAEPPSAGDWDGTIPLAEAKIVATYQASRIIGMKFLVWVDAVSTFGNDVEVEL